MSGMIQTYFNDIQQKYNKRLIDPKQEALRTHVRAYEPKGHIIKTSPFSLSNALQNDKESIKYFIDGIQGYGNDYSIGRINDTAIKLSGLGIAGMLATSQGSPLRKGMEFVGLACWLGAMSLWSKLAVNAPIRHFKGVDLDAEYVNSRGHKKHFYSDPQFICWDMISDSDMDKMADKLGIPKNIKNRRKATENKARQVAIQGNTLSLLTAGFATPLAASLVADKLGKHVLSPLILKTQEASADKLARKMALNVTNLVQDKKAELFIENELPDIVTPKTMQGIRKMFGEMAKDKVLSAPINATLDRIFGGENIKKTEMLIGDETIKNIISAYQKTNKYKVDVKPLVEALVNKYSGRLTDLTLSTFIGELEKTMLKNRVAPRDVNAKIVKAIKEQIFESRNLTLVSPDKTADQLKELSRILKTYDVKVNQMFNEGFYKKVWNGAVSTHSSIWEAMPQQVIKAFVMDNKTIKALSDAPSEMAANKVLGGFIDKVVSNKEYYDRVMDSLGQMAAKHNARNEKHLKFTLDYLDSMQKLFTAYDAKGEMSEMSQFFNLMFTKRRREIFGKYASANNTMFSPIRILSILKEARGTNDYQILKKVLFENMSVESFINRLDNLKEVIKNEADYKRIVNKAFSVLSDETKAKLPMGLGEKIDDITTLMRHLLVNQTDEVNVKYALNDVNAVSAILKKMGLYKYTDDFFEININSQDSLYRELQSVINENPKKADELAAILRLSDNEVVAIKGGDYDSLWRNLFGSSEIGKGMAENGRQRMRKLLEFAGKEDFSSLGGFNIRKAKEGIVSSMQATSFTNFMQDNAQKVFSYNKWFKRVGLAFVGLCAITAYGISRIGKKNAFNPDVYEERRA